MILVGDLAYAYGNHLTRQSRRRSEVSVSTRMFRTVQTGADRGPGFTEGEALHYPKLLRSNEYGG